MELKAVSSGDGHSSIAIQSTREGDSDGSCVCKRIWLCIKSLQQVGMRNTQGLSVLLVTCVCFNILYAVTTLDDYRSGTDELREKSQSKSTHY